MSADTEPNTATLEARDPHEVMDDYLPGEHREPAAESRQNHSSFVAVVPQSRYVDDGSPQVEELTLDAKLLAARFLTFVRWAGNDPARLAIVAALLNIDDRPQAQIAREHRISEDKINRAVRDGKAFLREVRACQSET